MPARWRIGTIRLQALTVEACWRPMEGDTAGDFHEVMDLRDGRVALVVGDAPGFGPEAAALAEDLRAALRRRFGHTTDPAAVLSELDAALSARGDDLIATAACAVVDPEARTVEVVNAGHLPPVVAEGPSVALLDGWADPPLGIAAARTTLRYRLAPDSALFLYTDGLIERRGTPLDAAIDQLLAASRGIGGARAWASEFARRATERFGQPTDDATVVSLQLTAASPGLLVADEPPAERQPVSLRVYLDPGDVRSQQFERVIAALVSASQSTLDMQVRFVDVTGPSMETEAAGVLAAPTVVREQPGPPVRAIGWFWSASELARALHVPFPEES
ncbi:MAG: PP2C family protein-serine/threonine phosphatase [Actinomycetota bacterium]|jgi:hypothetical protein